VRFSLVRFAKMVEAKKVDVNAIKPVGLRREVKKMAGELLQIGER